MSEEDPNLSKKQSFKHEWNNFSIYCWSLMEKCMIKLDDNAKENLKRSVLEAKTTYDKVNIILDCEEVMSYLKIHIDYLNNKNSIERKKDNKFASNCKKIGDLYFSKNRFHKSLKFYSKAILFYDKNDESKDIDGDTTNDDSISLDDTISLSQLYICRAKSLIKLEKLTEAYADFKQALILEPDIRNHQIDSDNLAMYYKPDLVDFKLRGENEKLDGASTSVYMDYCDEKGRMIKAQRQIDEGEILFMEQPYVHWLRPTYFDMYCHQCLKRLNKYIYTPCDQCTEIKFCSIDCKELAWNRYHRIECKYLRLLKKWPSGHMALRLILRDGIDYALNEENKPKLHLSEYPKLGFKADFSFMKSLTGEDSFMDGDYYFPLVIGCILIALLLEMNNEIKKEELITFSALLIKSIMQILENTFMIYDYEIKAIDEKDFFEDETKNSKSKNLNDDKQNYTRFHQMSSTSYKIGVGLYSSTSLIPHSCDNNSNKFYFGSSILIVASKPIEANHEVNIEYGVHYKMNSLKYRKEYLKNNFGFDCKCQACIDGLENEGLSLKCLKCLNGALIRDQNQENHCLNCDAKNLDLALVDEEIKKAENHFLSGIEAYKQNDMKKAENEFRAGEKICTKAYYNDVKLQFIKCELSHLYLVKKNYALSYHYLFQTLPINKNLYGANSLEVLSNHIELACLTIDCIENLTKMSFSVKQTSQKLFRQLLIKMKNRSLSSINKNSIKNLDTSSFEDKIDKKLTNCNELEKWKIIFKRHYQAIVQLYSKILIRDAKIASTESICSLYKLNRLKKYSDTNLIV